MKTTMKFWNWRKLAARLAWGSAVGCAAMLANASAFAQHAGGHAGGSGQGGGGGQAGGAAHAGGGGGAAHVNGGGAAHVNNGGAVRMAAPSGGGQFRAPTAGAGAAVRAPAAAGNAAVRAPAVGGNAAVRGPAINGNAAVRAPAVSGQAAVRAPAISGQVATPNVGANAAVGAHTTLRPNTGTAGAATAANVGAQSATNVRANWHTATPAQLQNFRTTFGQALNANTAALRANTAANAALQANPQRAALLANQGAVVRSNFLGTSPFLFNQGFYTGRNLIGLGGLGYGGLGGYGVGGLGGYGYGGLGGGLGNWWGYSPWMGNQPMNYWYGNTGWNNLAGTYGWNQPYYYDYGPNGNVAYQGNQVLVNNQPVGTASDYAQSAAELAAITPEQMNAPHDWMPLGTFAVATGQDDKNPVRAIQLAYDNKQGLISGTIHNAQSNNTYTVQGRVDPETQRTAFSIGNDPNTVMETGLYNLTQQETPVLVHFGPSKTATYMFARLPEPSAAEQPTTTAAAPAPVPVQPADDLRR